MPPYRVQVNREPLGTAPLWRTLRGGFRSLAAADAWARANVPQRWDVLLESDGQTVSLPRGPRPRKEQDGASAGA
jgi:hypothetical protein